MDKKETKTSAPLRLCARTKTGDIFGNDTMSIVEVTVGGK